MERTQDNQKIKFALFGVIGIIFEISQVDNIIAIILGIQSQRLVTATTTFMLLLFVASNKNHFKRKAKFNTFFPWAFLIAIGPVLMGYIHTITGTIKISTYIFWTAKYLSFFILFLSSIILFDRSNKNTLRKIALIIFALIAFGYIVQLLQFDFIREQLRFRNITISEQSIRTRAIGFFSHSNKMAVALFFAYILLDKTSENSNPSANTFIKAFLILLIFLTGSRTIQLLIFIYIFVSLLHAMRNKNNYKANATRLLYLSALVSGIPLLAILFHIFNLSLEAPSQFLNDIFERFFNLISTVISDGEDSSTLSRYLNLLWFIEQSTLHPFGGHGLGATQLSIQNGLVTNVSQNTWAQWAYELGYPFTLTSIIAMIIIINFNLRSRCSNTLLILLIFFATFSFNNIFTYEPIICLSALILHLGRSNQPGTQIES